MDSLARDHMRLLERVAALDDPPCLIGGYAEDALLFGAVSRPHGDLDIAFPRRELELRLDQARALGFREFETWGEAAPGEPFYIFVQEGELKLEIAVLDEEDGALWMKVHSLAFDIGGKEPASGYRIRLPGDAFDHPPVALDGIAVRVLSPLALHQMRAGVGRMGSFGPLDEKQRESARRIRERFFADRSEDELAPLVEPLDPDLRPGGSASA